MKNSERICLNHRYRRRRTLDQSSWPSPNRFLRLTQGFVEHLDRIEPGGCTHVLQRMLEEQPRVVVMNLWTNASDCERWIAAELPKHRYRRRRVNVGPMNWLVFRAAGVPAST